MAITTSRSRLPKRMFARKPKQRRNRASQKQITAAEQVETRVLLSAQPAINFDTDASTEQSDSGNELKEIATETRQAFERTTQQSGGFISAIESNVKAEAFVDRGTSQLPAEDAPETPMAANEFTLNGGSRGTNVTPLSVRILNAQKPFGNTLLGAAKIVGGGATVIVGAPSTGTPLAPAAIASMSAGMTMLLDGIGTFSDGFEATVVALGGGGPRDHLSDLYFEWSDPQRAVGPITAANQLTSEQFNVGSVLNESGKWEHNIHSSGVIRIEPVVITPQTTESTETPVTADANTGEQHPETGADSSGADSQAKKGPSGKKDGSDTDEETAIVVWGPHPQSLGNSDKSDSVETEGDGDATNADSSERENQVEPGNPSEFIGPNPGDAYLEALWARGMGGYLPLIESHAVYGQQVNSGNSNPGPDGGDPATGVTPPPLYSGGQVRPPMTPATPPPQDGGGSATEDPRAIDMVVLGLTYPSPHVTPETVRPANTDDSAGEGNVAGTRPGGRPMSTM